MLVGPDTVGLVILLACADDPLAMHLPEPRHRVVSIQVLFHTVTGLFHACGLVTAVQAQIETIPGFGGDVAGTGRHRRTNRRMRVPVRP